MPRHCSMGRDASVNARRTRARPTPTVIPSEHLMSIPMERLNDAGSAGASRGGGLVSGEAVSLSGSPVEPVEWDTRRWRTLDMHGKRCFLEADLPRVVCGEHGKVTVAVPRARHDDRF